MTTRKVTQKDGAATIAMLDEERSATTKKSSGQVTEMRRCSGSARFGVEPHEAPISAFPRQPSRKDGLGVMCGEHWKAYVKGLREARGDAAGTKPKAARPRARKATARPSAKAGGIAKAERLIADVDTLPADEAVRRVGDEDVQAALETSAMARTIAD